MYPKNNLAQPAGSIERNDVLLLLVALQPVGGFYIQNFLLCKATKNYQTKI